MAEVSSPSPIFSLFTLASFTINCLLAPFLLFRFPCHPHVRDLDAEKQRKGNEEQASGIQCEGYLLFFTLFLFSKTD